MFRILKYSVDEVSKQVDLKVIFQLKQNGNLTDDGGLFTSRITADAWLYKLKAFYFNYKVENFICYHKNIIESSPGHKSLQAKNEALKMLSDFLVWSVEKAKLDEACSWLLKIQTQFEKVLPPVKHESYSASTDELKAIIDFAKSQTITSLKQAS